MKVTKRPKKVTVFYTKIETYHSKYTCPSCHTTFVGVGIHKNVLRFCCTECGQELIIENKVKNN